MTWGREFFTVYFLIYYSREETGGEWVRGEGDKPQKAAPEFVNVKGA
jgi:hypothetical protein